MNILVIGSGGREHALVRQFKKSAVVGTVYVAPGNDGMRREAECVAIDSMDFASLSLFVKDNEIALTFVGPEQPLAAGIVDYFTEQGQKIFGPTQAAARLEGSKSFAKELMAKYSIPTSKYGTFTNVIEAKQFISDKGTPIVVKADGLAAGKGVVVALTLDEAYQAVEEMIGNHKFGESSSRVVIEEFLEGEEFSFMSFVFDGEVYPMPIAQDHKRAFDGDTGPNTGGMGAYSPVPQISQVIIDLTYTDIIMPTIAAMAKEGTPFNGILYAGLILTTDGPKVIEFNARLGDPEAQVVLPRMTSDFAKFMDALMSKRPFELTWHDDAVLGVVVASNGYPDEYEAGITVPDLEVLTALQLDVFHAATKSVNGELRSNGGRVIVVSAKEESLEVAQTKVYEGLSKLKWDGFFYRKDIGWRTFI